MNIGIIGAGKTGGALTRRLAVLGHTVSVANSRGPDTLADLAKETGARPVSVKEVAHAGELVIVSIPEGKIRELPKDLFVGVPDSVVVVDTGNYYPQRDGCIKEVENGLTESQWVAQQLGRPVIKAFNNIRSQYLLKLARPAGSPTRIGLPVAGDDPSAKQLVLKLVDELGFDSIDAGTIEESWRQQPGTPVYATDLDADGVQRALKSAKKERPLEFRSA